jgi:hypothetical protein
MNVSWGAIGVGSAVEKSTRFATAIARTLLGSYADCIVGNQNRCVSGSLRRDRHIHKSGTRTWGEYMVKRKEMKI